MVERNPASDAPQRRRGGLPRAYVATWVVLSSLALAYLVTSYVRPELAEGLGGQMAALVGVESEAGQEEHAREEQTRTELAALRSSLEVAQREAASLRVEIAAREEQNKAMAARLAAVEPSRTGELGLPISTASVNRGPLDGPGTAVGAGGDTLPGRAVEGQVVEAPQVSELPARRPAREAERTAAVAFGPAQVKPAAPVIESPRGIQIATGPSVDALRISWMLLADRHKELLGSYEPRFVPSTSGSGPAYRLIAGPIESTGAANKICTELRAKRVTCGVSAFGGEPL